ncbi:MAG: M20 family metallo-hydrolase [Maritimibacter sp.]
MMTHNWGALAATRLAQIAKISDPGPGVTRLPFTPNHKLALSMIGHWMDAAGLDVHLDAAGTLIGRREGPPGAPTFLIGSHQDSVRQGGGFDGIMGVALGCLALEKLASDKETLPFAVEILAFADEEGVRFATALMGPRALAGTFDPAVLDMQDSAGITLRQAMQEFGLNPEAVPGLARQRADVLGYLEVHIEQGPVLEDADQALGVVTAICGIERHQIVFTGETGHAGTLPMRARRDALVGASEFIVEVSRFAQSQEDLRATVGTLTLEPGAVNAVPREVHLTLELRAPIDAIRQEASRYFADFAREIAQKNDLGVTLTRSYAQPAAPCSPDLIPPLTRAVGETGGLGLHLPSGATHDASAMSDLCPIAMLFVRCRGGVSHRPDEWAKADDMGEAIDAMARFLTDIPAQP